MCTELPFQSRLVINITGALLHRSLLVTALSIVLIGCASSGSSPTAKTLGGSFAATSSNEQADTIATDMVSALMQLTEFPAWATTVQFADPATAFGHSLVDTFRASGYGVQLVSADQGLNNVTYSRRELVTEQGIGARYSVRIRDIEIQRDFSLNDGQFVPVSALRIVGTEPQNIALNDDIYRQLGNAGEFPSGVEFIALDGSVVDYKKHRARVSKNSKRSKKDFISQQRFLIVARSRTLFTQKISNSADVRKWPAVAQVTLIFPTADTAILGAQNKRSIKQVLNSFDPRLHGVSLTGCASNKSLLWDGTEGASLDRQRRVFDELLVAGVPLNLIRENGCFGSEFEGDLPKQAVILTVRANPRPDDT